MKIAIHQPEHFPYIGFFKKMQLADIFVILDDVQYVKGNWHNRNRFLNTNGIEEFFNVAVESDSYKKYIKDVITMDTNWRLSLLRKLKQNFKYDLEYVYSHKKLIDINMESIYWCMRKLSINTPIIKSSELNINTIGTQRLIDICTVLNGTEYLSGQGGKKYLDESLFSDITLTYVNVDVPNYYSSLYNIYKGYTL